MKVDDLTTPALVVDVAALDHNIATMAAAWPGRSLRPHVKAWKCTALGRAPGRQRPRRLLLRHGARGRGDGRGGPRHRSAARQRGGRPTAGRLRVIAHDGRTRVTVAVDSDATIDAAADAGIADVLVDVNVGLPRCGCAPGDAGRLADRARRRGITVRGVMGYEGHLMMEPDDTKAAKVEAAMAALLAAHAEVGGDVVSGGGTGTYATNRWVTELQAGSFALMDTDYGRLGAPFRQALHVHATVISVGATWAVADAGLKALAMDHGNPTVEGGKLWFVSDEHTTFSPADGAALPRSATAYASSPRTSTRRSPSTSACT